MAKKKTILCRALRDGLVEGDRYIHEGDTFEAEKCPSWAEAVKTPALKGESEETASDDKEQA